MPKSRTTAGGGKGPVVARAPGPRWLHAIVGVVAIGYLLSVFLNSSGSGLPRAVLPRPALFFAQVACLFPNAAVFTIEYRVEAFSCEQRRFVPFDHRAYFPVHPDDKENRLHRAAHFYRRDAKVMRALEAYIIDRHNSGSASQRAAAGLDERIGGIHLLSLRIPFPEPGTEVERYRYDPTAAVPREWRKPWYITPKARRAEHCQEVQ